MKVWTVSEGVTSQPLIRQDRLYPEAVAAINATFISDTEITLAWMKPKGNYDSFEVGIMFCDPKSAEGEGFSFVCTHIYLISLNTK